MSRENKCVGADDPDHAGIKAGGGVEWENVMNDFWVGDKNKAQKK